MRLPRGRAHGERELWREPRTSLGLGSRRAARRGAHLIVIDPRPTELATIAAVHLRPRPGTAIPLFRRREPCALPLQHA